jgi:hypothetical protein
MFAKSGESFSAAFALPSEKSLSRKNKMTPRQTQKDHWITRIKHKKESLDHFSTQQTYVMTIRQPKFQKVDMLTIYKRMTIVLIKQSLPAKVLT